MFWRSECGDAVLAEYVVSFFNRSIAQETCENRLILIRLAFYEFGYGLSDFRGFSYSLMCVDDEDSVNVLIFETNIYSNSVAIGACVSEDVDGVAVAPKVWEYSVEFFHGLR